MIQSVKIAIPNGEGFSFVCQEELLYGIANGRNTILHFENRAQIETTRNLKEVMSLLSKELFIRVHHSHFVGIKHLISFKNEGTCLLQVSDGRWLHVSRSRKKGLMDRFVRV